MVFAGIPKHLPLPPQEPPGFAVTVLLIGQETDFLLFSDTNVQEAASKARARLDQLALESNLRSELYLLVDSVHLHAQDLDAESQRLNRLKGIQARINAAKSEFKKNLVQSRTSGGLYFSREELDGVPEAISKAVLDIIISITIFLLPSPSCFGVPLLRQTGRTDAKFSSSRAYSADVFDAFFRHDPMSATEGRRFRQVLEKSGTRDELEIIDGYLGRSLDMTGLYKEPCYSEAQHVGS
ncbi:hypothetical protein HIM_01449 [Hirsutella minnesotensis 3608]|nr:hypothetical protein HIM_01449 [Hirsutella minnesotensis 3608]